jgi:hypothetical protein
MHGAGGGAGSGKGHPKYQHGERSRASMSFRASMNVLMRDSRKAKQGLSDG